ncbi:MAG: amidohydrolase family protein [Candidatus Hodarchaeota archaeon]
MSKFDLIIQGGKIVDGTGNSWLRADLGINRGRIAQIGELSGHECRRLIDASSLIVSPGFIDIHSHSDFSLITNPKAESHLKQGVTTVVIGNCGLSPFPVQPEKTQLLMEYSKNLMVGAELTWADMDGYFAQLQEPGLSVNVVPLVGFGNLRVAVMGMDNRKPSEGEMSRVKEILATHLRSGLFGMSTVLIKPPDCFSTTQELTELCDVVAANHGFYATHLRSESNGLENALNEAIDIGRRASVPVQVSHHKAAGRSNWGKTQRTIEIMDKARAEGVDVMCDLYPYLAASTDVVFLLPPWLHEGGLQKLLQRIEQRDVRSRVRSEIAEGYPDWWNPVREAGGWEKVTLISVASDENKWVEGLTVPQVSEKKDQDLYDALFDLLIEEQGVVRMVIEMMCEEDVERILKYPFAAIGSDGWCEDLDKTSEKGLVHPRLYGTFPRILGEYVRNRSVIRLEEAIRKMTSLPAQRLGLWDRGILRQGMAADIVVFDADTVEDTATYTEPRSFPIGIQYVMVNGEVAVDRGKYVRASGGRILRK